MLAGAADAAIIPAGIGGFIACKVRSSQLTGEPGERRTHGMVGRKCGLDRKICLNTSPTFCT